MLSFTFLKKANVLRSSCPHMYVCARVCLHARVNARVSVCVFCCCCCLQGNINMLRNIKEERKKETKNKLSRKCGGVGGG